jgi:hypothetical protein
VTILRVALVGAMLLAAAGCAPRPAIVCDDRARYDQKHSIVEMRSRWRSLPFH